MKKVIIAAPAGETREQLKSSLEAHDVSVISLERESFIADGALAIVDEKVMWGDVDLIDGTIAAIITDSGYMWPLPNMSPTPEQWESAREDFDGLLRDDRERESLWYSLMSILEDRLPLCINPASAFAFGAMKPLALTTLSEEGLHIAPFLATNESDELARFAKDSGGAFLQIPLVPNEPTRWLEPESLSDLPLDQEPVLIQSLSDRELLHITVVGDEAIPLGAGEELSAEILELVVGASKLLGLIWADLTLQLGPRGPLFVDFDPSPSLGRLEEPLAQRITESLWKLIQPLKGQD